MIKGIYLMIIMTILVKISNAQNLPKIQEGNMKAPTNIKIDGLANDWGNTFKAYNPTNHLHYNIANDEKYLYLIARMDGDGQTIFKAVGGGFIFGIQTDNLKQTNLKSITYPAKVSKNEILIDFGFDAQKFKKTSNQANKQALDSISKLANKKIQEYFKEIEIVGMRDEGTERIALYNTEGIKVSAKFNSQMEYVIEIAIPLQFLGLDNSKAQKFKYNIGLKGTTADTKMVIKDMSWMPENARFPLFTTDLWGEYTLLRD